MNTRHWKRLILSAAVAVLSLPGLASAAPLCAYVLGDLETGTVATPAIPIYIPGTSVDIQPVRVHLDETEQDIFGYSLRIPGLDVGYDPKAIFVPAFDHTISPLVFSLPDLNLVTETCINLNVTTPAVPVHIPASALQVPGAVLDVPAIKLNILGHPVTTPGKIILFEGKTIVIPEIDFAVPGVPLETPEGSIVFTVNGVIKTARFLAPNE